MALSRTLHTQATSETSGLSFTTGSYTFANGSLVVVVLQSTNEGGGEDPSSLFSIDDTGADLTWTRRLFVDDGAQHDYSTAIVVWTATANGTSCTLTITKASGANVGRWLVQPLSYTGHNTSTPIGATLGLASPVSDGSWAPTLSGSPASTSEVIAAIVGVLNSGAPTVTNGTGWTELYDTAFSEWSANQGQVRGGSISATVTWDDIIVGGGGYYHNPVGAAFEIVAAAGSGVTTMTAEDVVAVVDTYISLLNKNRDQAEVTLVSEGGLVSSALHNLSVLEFAIADDSFLSRRLSTSQQGDTTITIDSFLSSVSGNTINTVTASDVLAVADAFVSLILRLRDQAETTIISEGSLDISTLYNMVVSESLEIADSLIRRMLLNMQQGDTVISIDDFISSVVGQNLVSIVASDAVQVTWQALLSALRNNIGTESAATIDSVFELSLFSVMASSMVSSVDESLAQLIRFMSIVDVAETVDSVSAVFTPFVAADGSKIRIGSDQPRIQLGGYTL